MGIQIKFIPSDEKTSPCTPPQDRHTHHIFQTKQCLLWVHITFFLHLCANPPNQLPDETMYHIYTQTTQVSVMWTQLFPVLLCLPPPPPDYNFIYLNFNNNIKTITRLPHIKVSVYAPFLSSKLPAHLNLCRNCSACFVFKTAIYSFYYVIYLFFSSWFNA